MPNPLDMARLASNPLIAAGAGMLAGSMQRPQAQAHINPWQQGVRNMIGASSLGVEQDRAVAAKQYTQSLSDHQKWQQEEADTERSHDIAMEVLKAKLKAQYGTGTMSEWDKMKLGLFQEGIEGDMEASGPLEASINELETALALMDGGVSTGLGGDWRKWIPGGASKADVERLSSIFGKGAIQLLSASDLTPVSDTDVDWIKSIAPNMSFQVETNVAIIKTQVAAAKMALAKINYRKQNMELAFSNPRGFEQQFQQVHGKEMQRLQNTIDEYKGVLGQEPIIKNSVYKDRYGL